MFSLASTILRPATAAATAVARRTSLLAPTMSAAGTSFGNSRYMSGESATFDITGSYTTHMLDGVEGLPGDSTVATKDELMSYFRLMYTMRRMEITCDNEYKARAIRGFCHLYDGQEAIATGIEAAFNHDDSWITSYRCHCVALARGGTVAKVLGELFGFRDGYTKGRGGSMHFYNKAHNFYGGQGIVGAQVPVGAGLAFANKYKTPAGEKMPVAITCYGDGAANQGQIWESANMAALWKLPLILCIENNQYGMGTSIDRHSSHMDYYKMGNIIPGIKMDGMNVLAVREGMKFAKEYCSSGNGPLYVEMTTYRYHGHSMSDPGTTYRNREEIAATRSKRDPVEWCKRLIIEGGFETAESLKAIEKGIRKDVQGEVAKAKQSQGADTVEELWMNVYSKDGTKDNEEKMPFMRMPNYANSITP
mmetsp:Transcript_48152/g.94029  ORF Transcript_48152/g.94029 Transcript_48152/m.94029 type:complete len:421 (+) Transcript_48152:91-1353(+)